MQAIRHTGSYLMLMVSFLMMANNLLPHHHHEDEVCFEADHCIADNRHAHQDHADDAHQHDTGSDPCQLQALYFASFNKNISGNKLILPEMKMVSGLQPGEDGVSVSFACEIKRAREYQMPKKLRSESYPALLRAPPTA